jgi:hypothetical protein
MAKQYEVVALDDFEGDDSGQGRAFLAVRRRLGIRSFGVNAFRAAGEEPVVREHTETGLGATGQEELYVVVSGHAVFDIDGERVDAPAGTLVFVGDPAAKRSAVAQGAETTIMVVGGTPGAAYDPAPEEAAEAMAAYNAGNYEEALAKQRIVLEKRPGNALALFNTACFEALLGRADDAIEHVRQAVEADSRALENVRQDADLDSLRDDERFVAIAGMPAGEPA